MVLRSAGLITILISLIFSFANVADEIVIIYRLLGLFTGILSLGLLSRSKFIDHFINKLIQKALNQWTTLELRDYESLLKLSENYTVTEIKVHEDDWLNRNRLKECKMHEEGIRVLGIYREDGLYAGFPEGEAIIYAGDILILYARQNYSENLNGREKVIVGDHTHNKQVQDPKNHM
jgi:hypothetical protein